MKSINEILDKRKRNTSRIDRQVLQDGESGLCQDIIDSIYYRELEIEKILDTCFYGKDDPLNGKTIKKMTWSNNGVTGIKVKIETDDGYILSYLLGFEGDLMYIDTKDSG